MIFQRSSSGRLAMTLCRSAIQRVGSGRRAVHNVAELQNVDISQGIPGLYSAEGLKAAWTDVQSYAVKELNNAIHASSIEGGNANLENLSVVNLVALSKAFPQFDSKIAYYAGQVYSNEFQMAGLLSESKGPNSFDKNNSQDSSRNADVKRVEYNDFRNAPIDISTTVEYNSIGSSIDSEGDNLFMRLIHRQFESEVSFRELFLTQASSTFSSGYTWLIFNNQDKKLYLMNTYGWGVPPLFSTRELQSIRSLKDASISVSQTDGNAGHANDRLDCVVPLLNVSVWQHAYLHDYGVFGKRKYLENFWNCINWKHVEQRCHASLASPDNTTSY